MYLRDHIILSLLAGLKRRDTEEDADGALELAHREADRLPCAVLAQSPEGSA